MLYGAHVWAEVMVVKSTKAKIMRVQRRSALRVALAYRTVSGETALIIAGLPPIDVLAHEQKYIFEGGERSRDRENTLANWQK
jgi:hypothetical protein